MWFNALEKIALGSLGWMPSDFKSNTVKDLIRAVEGFRDDRKELWEMTRIQCAYSIAPHHDTKKRGPLKYADIVLPIDAQKQPRKETGKVIALNKDEIREAYTSSGFEIDEEELERIVNENRN